MSCFSQELRQKLEESPPCGAVTLPAQADQRLEALAGWCPVYRDFLRRHPEFWIWLEDPANGHESFRLAAHEQTWRQMAPPESASPTDWLAALQRFRRLLSMRIAFRDINRLTNLEESLEELTLLAEFVLHTVTDRVRAGFEERLGVPWDEFGQRPARFCILGLGKLGSRELNFCSDLDLIFLYQGQGHTRREGRGGGLSNEEFFSRLAREITRLLTTDGMDGNLYNIDLRLRPEGQSGPLVRSLSAIEAYYSAAGQTWERLALVKARQVAGDATLGTELFEALHNFRYPRRPPHSLLAEIAGLKIRIEKEVLGEAHLERHVKSGHGGIREIEFFVQAHQMTQAGRYPFLQTPSTLSALDGLERYEIVPSETATFLRRAYFFLRNVEHRLQMREEQQTHLLPEPGPERDRLAIHLGYVDGPSFDREMGELRRRVREIYLSLFGGIDQETEILEWTLFFSGQEPARPLFKKLRHWFWGPLPPVYDRLRRFLLGASPNALLTREHIVLFLEIASQFDQALPPLAHPMNTLERLNQFAERYGARKQFLRTCAHRPKFFQAMGLLFDRSRFIHELLCRQPEILEEIFIAGLRSAKNPADMAGEIALGPGQDDERLAAWLWLYVRAEQVRLAILEVLTGDGMDDLEDNLRALADTVLGHLLNRVDPGGRLAIVALGKLGSGELTFGSDLDLLPLGQEEGDGGEMTRSWQRLLRLAGHSGPHGNTYDIDLRLRPYGQDGPLLVSLPALERYHQGSAGVWEKQMLTRARPLPARAGPPHPAEAAREHLRAGFVEWRDRLLYREPISAGAIGEIRHMRQKIEDEKARGLPPGYAVKAGPGGLIDHEFLIQTLQLRHGWRLPALRTPHLRQALAAACAAGLLSPDESAHLQPHYRFLRRLEMLLRRDRCQAVNTLSTDPDEQVSLAKWTGFETFDDFLASHRAGLARTRAIYDRVMQRESAT